MSARSAPLGYSGSARALTKHTHRDLRGEWWPRMSGSEAAKNAAARGTLARLLGGALWLNLHQLPPFAAPKYVLELRNEQGYGARWAIEGVAAAEQEPSADAPAAAEGASEREQPELGPEACRGQGPRTAARAAAASPAAPAAASLAGGAAAAAAPAGVEPAGDVEPADLGDVIACGGAGGVNGGIGVGVRARTPLQGEGPRAAPTVAAAAPGLHGPPLQPSEGAASAGQNGPVCRSRQQRCHPRHRAVLCDASQQQATTAASSPPVREGKFEVTLQGLEALQTVKLDLVPDGKGQAVVVTEVAEGSQAEELGVRRGQKLNALSDPMRYGTMWNLQDRPSLRFVVDTFKMRRASPIDLEFEPMLGFAGGPQPPPAALPVASSPPQRDDTGLLLGLAAAFLLPPLVILVVAYFNGYLDRLYLTALTLSG
ncbi:hypothetical protein TSOC_004905 [Tetrabaena socialis]|uniref:PDZ domain-containing protein n=1 Tax=Tetrabaena socialis TaxID=47790 RepID=A0A2J8A7M9_9CHLO|nr:hypothetical protein TSOC_004905 [Tetrabaena socialis]|eukprot:PNH08534.1 hypothetical protein TSOC_004905 [Tetrabaena socialis]